MDQRQMEEKLRELTWIGKQVVLADPAADADYHARVEAALQATCRADYPAGMVGWLENGDPALYEELTSWQPDLIHRLWEAHAPLDEFQHIVDAWLAAHERACALYRAAQPGGTKLGQKPPVGSKWRGQLGGDDGHG